MKEVVNFLNENKNGFLATAEDGKPKVRPFQFMFEEGGKFFFCTSNTKEVYRQLQSNPYVEFSSNTPSFVWIRLGGEVKFSNDIKIKEKIIEANPLVKSIYETANNPIFEIFFIEHGVAVISDFSGQPPEKFEF